MNEFDTSALISSCPVRDILNRLSDRWSLLTLHELMQTPVIRFGEFRRAIPDISPRMLSQTLRCLEQDGLIQREAYATIPPRVDYSLTPLGQSFMGVVEQLLQWAKVHQDDIHLARESYQAPEISNIAK